MAHLTEGTLRRMVDDPDSIRAVDESHLEGCSECQARRAAIADDSRAIGVLLAVPEPVVNLSAALDRVRSAPDARPRFGVRLPMLRPFSRPFGVAMAAGVAAVALVVTAIASGDFLYSPNSVTAVPVTVADMESLSQLSAYGSVSWTTKPELQIVNSAAEAQSVSGLKPPAVSKLPAGVSTNITYAAMTKAVATFTFSASQAAASVASTGKPLPALPKNMDGAQLTVSVGPAVGEIYGNLNSQPSSSSGITAADLPQLVVLDTVAPTVTSTQVSAKQLEDYLLSLPGLSSDLKTAIKAIGNPSTTLPIPIPIEYATSTSVTVNGNAGVALGDNTGLGSGVIWVQHGDLFAVAGTIKQSDALNIADNLH